MIKPRPIILMIISKEYSTVNTSSATTKKGYLSEVGSWAIITAEFRPITVIEMLLNNAESCILNATIYIKILSLFNDLRVSSSGNLSVYTSSFSRSFFSATDRIFSFFFWTSLMYMFFFIPLISFYFQLHISSLLMFYSRSNRRRF